MSIKILAAIIFLYLVFRIATLTPVFSDEMIYLNMAKAVASGLLPYKDFFYAHPPTQLFLLAPAAFFGNFEAVKIFVTILGIGSIFLTYLIAKKIFNEKAGLVTALAFLIFPGFLIFGNLAMGTFEALFFFLLSFYFSLSRKIVLSNFFLSIAFFTRYLTILLVPFLLIYLLKFQRKIFNRYVLYFVLINAVAFAAIYAFFGNNFFIFTVFYHLQTNLQVFQLAELSEQYFVLGFFTISIAVINLVFARLKNDFRIFLFASYPLIVDLVLLLIFKQVIYHYFAFTLPLVFIAFGATFTKTNLSIVKFSLLTILALSIFTNLQSINFFFNKNANEVFNELVDSTLLSTNISDVIFGSAIPTNYVSFVTNRKVVNNYFDSDLKFINFAGKERIFNEITKAKPKVVIIDNNFNYISEIGNEYKFVAKMEMQNYYTLSIYKLT